MLADALVIFGATGDLAQRKLYPALKELHKNNKLPKRFKIIGISRKPLAKKEYHAIVKKSVKKCPKTFLELFSYHAQDFQHHEGYEQLEKILTKCKKPIFYLATAPKYFPIIAQELDEHSVAQNGRVLFEKPFGHDLASAQELNKQLRYIFNEEQLYRLDHYLGKDSVQNLMVLRFANTVFEGMWNRDHIDNVQITVTEDIGVGLRGPTYYDHAGALRDMIQNHLLQILSYVTMEAPVALEAEAIQDEKVKVLKNLRFTETVYGQYTGKKGIKGYKQEKGIKKNSQTETFVAIKASINNYRWQGVPFYLRTGKRLKNKMGKITITFKHVPCVLFSKIDPLADNQLVIQLQPEQKISFRFNTKKPGTKLLSTPVKMNFFRGARFTRDTPAAYEEILLAGINADKSHFTRWDETEAQWKVVEPLLKNPPKIQPYTVGSLGPKAAEQLVTKDGRTWQ